MNTTISDKIYIKSASQKVYWWCRDNLTVTNPTYDTLIRLNKQDQIARCHISPKMALYTENGMDLILPFGCLYSVWHLIKDSSIELKFNSSCEMSCKNDKIVTPLFDYQEEAIQKMLLAKGGILIGGCGSGKTNIGIELAHRIGKNTLWLCHTKDLLVQSIKRIKSLYPNMHIGTITEGKIDMVKDGITVATVQTLVNIDYNVYANNFDTVIVDETHRVSGSPTLSKYFVKIISKIPARYKFGLTASDSRNDTLTKSMYAYVGCNPNGSFEPVWRIDRKETKTLTAIHTKVDLDTPFDYCMLNDDGTFNYSNLVNYLSDCAVRNEMICNNIIKSKQEGRKQLVLCSRIEQCETLNNMLKENGVNSMLLVGKVSGKKREEILSEKTSWDVIVATISLAKEGLDVVSLDTLHLVSCIGNKSDTVQSVGRIERYKPDKKEPIVYDYVDINIPYLVSKYKKRVNWLKRR